MQSISKRIPVTLLPKKTKNLKRKIGWTKQIWKEIFQMCILYSSSVMKVHSMTSSMWRFKSTLVILILLAMLTSSVYARLPSTESGNPDAKRLYDDLLSNYNKLVRPVVNTTDPLTVRIKLKLSQLIDVVSNLLFLMP